MVVNAMQVGDMPTVLAVAILLAAVAVAANAGLLALDRRWRGLR
jgi:ABC-type nitrate/sulfonate/bicarbonate transport system permease component